MNNLSAPAIAQVGGKIEHDLVPGFVMVVQDKMACETGPARPLEHSKYLVTDPEGAEDWLCAYDVSRVTP